MTIGENDCRAAAIFEPAVSTPHALLRMGGMLERVGLSPTMMDRYPHEFSGGQCQRIGIARAMISGPKLLICDEPVSSLDVSIQGQIVNLLLDLQRDTGAAMLFISHNLAVVRHLSHRILVMYAGRLVEVATRDALFATPVHPYTRALLAAVPPPPARAPHAPPAPPAPSESPAAEPPAHRLRLSGPLRLCAAGLRTGSAPALEEAAAAAIGSPATDLAGRCYPSGHDTTKTGAPERGPRQCTLRDPRQAGAARARSGAAGL